jgi:hypothetical protein
MAMAAAVAVVAILAVPLLWRAADEHAANPRMADASSSPAPADARPDELAPAPPVPQTMRLDRAVRNAGSAWLGLASEATGTVREMAAFLPEQAVASAAQPEVEMRLPQAARWTEKLRSEIAPIQRDVGRAMDFLLEAVPLSRNRAI